MCAGRALRPLRLSKRYRACAQHRLYRPDAGVAAHYGAIVTDQRKLLAGGTFVDLSNREVLNISGADPLTLLHPLTTQFLEGLAPHTPTKALILSPQGRVEHAFAGYDDGETFWAHTEPGEGAALAGFLDKMKFMMRVEVTKVTDDWAVLGIPGQAYELVPRGALVDQPARLGDPVGTWAWEALRIEAGRPRGRAVELDGTQIGVTGSTARHHELGPIALAVIKCNVDVAATQEVIVDSEAGLHFRPTVG